MSDVDEIIDYIKSLKKGFDKDLFQSKIYELAHAVDNDGLDYEDFHTLFKVWLNLTIPITKWVSIGVCLVPQDRVKEHTVDYALRWLLANAQDQTSFSRIAFVFDWLTAAMDCESIDIAALDCGYEVFFSFLTFEVLAAHVLKLVYTLTKPTDVTRTRVLELFNCAKKRENKKSMCRQLQVLLGLFKSYKPECVPEDIPAVPVHTTFKSNITLLTRFKKWQEQRSEEIQEAGCLMWTNPILGSKTKKGESLVPNIEFLNIGSQLYQDKEPQRNYFDFADPVSLLQYSVHRSVSRPARLRALLRNTPGIVLLALSDARAQAALNHDLHYMLIGCFLDASPHSEREKRDALHCIAVVQRTLCQPLPAVTDFLAHLLPLWDEQHWFKEILELVEWVEVDPELLPRVLEPLTGVYHRAQPMQQCAILRSLTNMYTNMVYASTRPRQHFVCASVPRDIFADALAYVASTISAMCGRALQVDPEDHRALYSCVASALRIARAQLSRGDALTSLSALPALPVLPAFPAPPALTLPLVTVSADLLDKVAELILIYKEIMLAMQTNKENRKDQRYTEQKMMIRGYTNDVVRCLVDEASFSGRQSGYVFQRLHPEVVRKLAEYIPDADAVLSIRNHLAFAPYTYIHTDSLGSFADNEEWFDTVIKKEFTHLSTLLTMLGWGKKR